MPLASAALSLEWLEGTLTSYLNDTTTLLQIAPWSDYHTAGLAAVQDTVAAVTSCWTLLQLIWTPVLLGLYYIVTVTWDNLYRHVLTHVFSRSFAQLKVAAAAAYQWQCSLTPEMMAVELAFILMCVALYQLRRYIQQQAITQRVMNFYRRQQAQVQKRYRSTVQRIARGSLLLAAMTPHVLFASVAVGLKLLLPLPIQWLATETSVTSLLSWWYPVGATITLLHQISQEGKEVDADDANNNKSNNNKSNGASARPAAEEKENNAPPKQQRKSTKTSTSTTTPKARKPFFPRTTPASSTRDDDDKKKNRRRRSSFFLLPTTPRFHHVDPSKEVHEWLQYWMVYGAVQAIARLLYLLPGSSLMRYGTSDASHSFLLSAGLQLQLVFYIWIYVLPNIVLPIPDLPDTRPLVFLTEYMIRPTILSLTEAVSGAISQVFWERHVVGKLTSVTDAFVLIRFVKRETADWWLHLVSVMRHTAVPSITLLMPGMVTNYGVLYVQYAVPLAVAASTIFTNGVADKNKNDTNNKKQKQQQQQVLLQYWVLHALTQGVLEQCSSILWWIPLSTHFIFILWCYWNLDVSVQKWYPAVQQELQAFGLLPGCVTQEWESTRTSRIFNAVLARLPSAATDTETDAMDTTDDKNATATTTTTDVGQDPILQNDNGGLDGDDDDDEQEEYVPEEEADALLSTPTRGVVTRRSTRQRTTTTAN